VAEPAGPVRLEAGGAAPAEWAAAHAGELAGLLPRRGAVLVTGLPVRAAADLAALRGGLGLVPAPVRERFAPRRELADGVWSAPEWAADREQCLHHEQGGAVEVPRVLLLACLAPAAAGGALLLGDTRAALRALPADLADRFRAEGWRLDRTFRPYLGLPWTEAFGVADRDGMQRHAAEHDLDAEWLPDGALHVRQRRAAVVRHPGTGEDCWFNDVAFFSQWSVDAEERGVLLAAFGPDGIPYNTSFGSGGPLGEPDWRRVLDAYDAVMSRVEWRAGDVLVLDNLLTAHGREPFTGEWKTAVAPAEPVGLPAHPG